MTPLRSVLRSWQETPPVTTVAFLVGLWASYAACSIAHLGR